MEHNKDKEQWISEVMNSTEGMGRAKPGANLFERITSELNGWQQVKVITLPVKQWVAAAILLLALNAGSVIYFTEHNKKAGNTATGNPLAAEVQLDESTYNY